MSFPIAIWQGIARTDATPAALADLTAAATGAAAVGARLLVAPEVFFPGYNSDRIAELAQPRGGDWHHALSALCRETGCGLVVGYAERDGDAVFNAAVAFDATGAEVTHYRKTQLFGPREKAIFAPGDALCTFSVEGIKAAILICYDVEFAPLIRDLAGQGVRLILVPTANPEPNLHVSKLVVPAHAINHGLTIAYANYAGAEGDITYCGGSTIVAPDATVLAYAGPGPALITADIDRAPNPALIQNQLADYRAPKVT
ncbi:MAG: nitrilase [Rhodobacteraceae bacterium PARR1]|nr:MAG: nitrilase [Rhodobacteraceae bacterium PARR1]